MQPIRTHVKPEKKAPALFLLLGMLLLSLSPAVANESVNGDPYVDELLGNGVLGQSTYWCDVKSLLISGNVDEAIKRCRQVMARRALDIDMHCIYAMALEMKLRKNDYDDKLFEECVKEWAHVAKIGIIKQSNGWEHVGDGEVFVQNQERKDLANRHLVSLVGRAPKYFEGEDAFIRHAIKVRTEVAGKVVKKSM